jgi:tRNA(Leu) C34 or U34 (ribose-2'-O)-methylase TrmL
VCNQNANHVFPTLTRHLFWTPIIFLRYQPPLLLLGRAAYANEIAELCVLMPPEGNANANAHLREDFDGGSNGSADQHEENYDDDDDGAASHAKRAPTNTNTDADFFNSRPAFTTDPTADFAAVDTPVAQACLVRAVALSMLERAGHLAGAASVPVPARDSQSQSHQSQSHSRSQSPQRSLPLRANLVAFARFLLGDFLRRREFAAIVADTTPFARPMQRKSRAWQTLCILAPSIAVSSPAGRRAIRSADAGAATALSSASALESATDDNSEHDDGDDDDDAALMRYFHDAAWREFERPNKNETRQWVEVFLIHCVRTAPHALLARRLLPALATDSERAATLSYAAVCSLLIVAAFVALAMPPRSRALRTFGPRLLAVLFPYLSSNYGQARTATQFLWTLLYERYYALPPTLQLPLLEFELCDGDDIDDEDENGTHNSNGAYVVPVPDAITLSVYRFIAQNADALKARQRLARCFAHFSPRRLCTLAGHLADMGFQAPPFAAILQEAAASALSEIKIAHDGDDLVAARHAQAPGDLARGLELMTIQQQREQQQLRQQPALNVPHALEGGDADELNAAQADNYQQKIAPLQEVLEANNEETRARDLIVSSIRARRRHDLIVCASLVDRVPNLAGVRAAPLPSCFLHRSLLPRITCLTCMCFSLLRVSMPLHFMAISQFSSPESRLFLSLSRVQLCRTCEIFNCARLVVHDRAVLDEPGFASIAVTAHHWLPIEEVRESRVAAYLQQQKRAGYSILALEQTAHSVSLERFQFPSRAVILLGKEREGIPVHLIRLVDACIEIPQFGLIRSLNVHVSGAILMWSYVRQHCLNGPASESAAMAMAAVRAAAAAASADASAEAAASSRNGH